MNGVSERAVLEVQGAGGVSTNQVQARAKWSPYCRGCSQFGGNLRHNDVTGASRLNRLLFNLGCDGHVLISDVTTSGQGNARVEVTHTRLTCFVP